MAATRVEGSTNTQYDPTINDADTPVAGAGSKLGDHLAAMSEEANSAAQSHGTGGTNETRQATKTVDQEVNERLANDPDLQKAQAELEAAEHWLALYDLIDSNCGVQFNGNICRDDILALVNDVHAPNKAARDAAKFFNDNPSIWAKLSKGDALVGRHDIEQEIAARKGAVDARKAQVKSDVQAERGIATNQNAATGGVGQRLLLAQRRTTSSRKRRTGELRNRPRRRVLAWKAPKRTPRT